jgi:acyl-coenzyme A synthetase/AMP-(fatty) acid ligase
MNRRPSPLISFIPELEGHLLDHEYVADVCVVPIPNEYSGEVPLAFVVLHARLAKKIKDNPQEAQRVRAEIIKVRMNM